MPELYRRKRTRRHVEEIIRLSNQAKEVRIPVLVHNYVPERSRQLGLIRVTPEAVAELIAGLDEEDCGRIGICLPQHGDEFLTLDFCERYPQREEVTYAGGEDIPDNDSR